jgi:hypothetical protein
MNFARPRDAKDINRSGSPGLYEFAHSSERQQTWPAGAPMTLRQEVPQLIARPAVVQQDQTLRPDITAELGFKIEIPAQL